MFSITLGLVVGGIISVSSAATERHALAWSAVAGATQVAVLLRLGDAIKRRLGRMTYNRAPRRPRRPWCAASPSRWVMVCCAKAVPIAVTFLRECGCSARACRYMRWR